MGWLELPVRSQPHPLILQLLLQILHPTTGGGTFGYMLPYGAQVPTTNVVPFKTFPISDIFISFTPAGKSKTPSACPGLPGPGGPCTLETPPAVPLPELPTFCNLTSPELRPEPCGGACPRARKGVHASTPARALPRRPRGRVPKPAAGRAPRWLPRGRVRASAGGRVAPTPAPPARGSWRRAGSSPGTSHLVGKRQAGDGNSGGPAQSLHLSADLLSFRTCHGSLTFREILVVPREKTPTGAAARGNP